MKKILKTSMLVCLFSCFTAANAADVPMTSLTKNCKPLIDKNLVITPPPMKGLDARTYKRLTRAQERLAEELYDEGIQILVDLVNSTSSDHVKATVNIQIAYAYAQQGKQQESYPYFTEALKYGKTTLPNDRVQSLRLNVAGFMFMNGNKSQAVQLMEEWMKNSNVDDAYAYYLLAAMYADEEVGRMGEVVCPAYFAAKTSREPKKSYYQMILSAHWELKDIVGAAAVLTQMVEYFPENTSFWRQLSSIYMQLDKYQESLAVMEMLYLRGELSTEADYKSLSSLFSYEDIPLRSAQILEEGILKGVVKPEEKNWRAVAQSYHLSSDLSKAIVAYGKTAEISKTGDAFIKQAQLYNDKKQWNQAVKAFDKGIQKGGLKDIGRAYLDKGVVLISLEQCDNALKVLKQASKYKKQRSAAGGWTAYVKDRQRRNKC